ncbi:MAG: AAA family ATPase [Neisseriaceae bacterium]|nr:AAA family ATPase [Neisseriaceae bacterium]MBP6862424.1 AAA family ATPase [Neisseriaceae bacterium]
MKLAISGTYSSGKTRTVMALSHLTGIPRSLAQTMREIMPSAVPGKTLAQCTPAEFIQLMVLRHCGRAVNEAMADTDLISDGSSLQEWLYGAGRIKYGMDPNQAGHMPEIPRDQLSPEMLFFEDVIECLGHSIRQHVQSTFDGFIHLKNELPIHADSHRPMNSSFRDYCDRSMLEILAALNIRHYVIQGSIAERLTQITTCFDLPQCMSIEDAIAAANHDYAQLDLRLELARAQRS